MQAGMPYTAHSALRDAGMPHGRPGRHMHVMLTACNRPANSTHVSVPCDSYRPVRLYCRPAIHRLVSQPRDCNALQAADMHACSAGSCLQRWFRTLVTPRYEDVLLLGPERLRLPAGSDNEALCLIGPGAAGAQVLTAHGWSCSYTRRVRASPPLQSESCGATWHACCPGLCAACCVLYSGEPGGTE